MGSDLKRLVAGLVKKNPTTAVELRQSNPSPQRPLADLLGPAEPEPTQYELDFEWAQGQPPRKGVNPRLPWTGRGAMERVDPAEAKPLAPMEKVKLNNAMAKAKLGRRLTLAERRLLGKHNLACLVARIRPKGGDCG